MVTGGQPGQAARAPSPGIWLLGGWLAEWLPRGESVFCVRTPMRVAGWLRVRAYVRCRCRFTKVKRFSC